MRRSILLLTVAFLASIAILASADQGRKLTPQEINERAAAADQQIWHLTQKDFDQRIASGTWLIFFGVRLAPRWLGVQKRFLEDGLIEKDFNIAKVDCTDVDEWCASKKADAYPSLYLYHKGNFIEEYMGDHDPTPIYQYILQKITEFNKDAEPNVKVEAPPVKKADEITASPPAGESKTVGGITQTEYKGKAGKTHVDL
ncbi:Thioredoxin domain-containing protein 5 [Phlyctochytrium planicorne]|nr:Thioredoxin domain-containing protein 5 [Phlyctochytrium planicorne]